MGKHFMFSTIFLLQRIDERIDDVKNRSPYHLVLGIIKSSGLACTCRSTKPTQYHSSLMSKRVKRLHARCRAEGYMLTD